MEMMSLRNWIILSGLSAAAACGTVKDPMMGDDGPPVDDTTAPKLMSSTPADNGTKVTILSKLTFVFDEALAPESVTDAGVTVTYLQIGYPTPVKGTVKYDDASHTVTFTPQLPLNNGMRYSVHVANTVTDVAGNAFSGADLGFLTSVNSETKSVYYNSQTFAVSGWTGYTLDANGRMSKYLSYDAVGLDGNWFTTDDHVGYRYDYNYNANGQLLDQRSYLIGPDNVWNTADDTISGFYKYSYDSSGRQTEYMSANAPGPDGMWGTADDPVASLNTYVYSPNLVRQTQFSGPGNDGVWRTADDKANSFYEYTFNAQGLRTRYVRYLAGPDQLPKTSDDTVSYYFDFEYNANYSMTLQAQRTSGADTIWLTADDGYSYVSRNDYDAKGAQSNYLAYNTPGPDMVWLTTDDVPNYRQAFTSDANGLMIANTSFSGAGPDTLWNTADDVISGYYTYTYDQGGNKTDYKQYGSSGPDMVWRTGDDRVGYDSDYDLAH